MNQISIISFFNKTQKNSASKRKYQDVVDQLVEEAQKLFEKKETKSQGSENNKVKDHKTELHMSYKKYTLQQKEAILKLVPCLSYAAIEAKFGVDESTVRAWVNNGVKEDGRKKNGKMPKASEFEDKLMKRLTIIANKGGPLNSRSIFNEVKNCYAEDFGLKNNDYDLLQRYGKYCSQKKINENSILYTISTEEVKSLDQNDKEITLTSEEKVQLRDAFLKIKQSLILIDSNWLHRFTSRNGLSYRKVTHLGHKYPEELESEVIAFLKKIHQLRNEYNIPPELIINFDETAIYYDTIPSHCYFKVGVQHPNLKVSKVQKKRFTAGLGISAAGDKLNPILIFQGKGKRLNNLTNTEGYEIKKNENAWMTGNLFKFYLKSTIKIFLVQQRMNPDIQGKKGLLILDGFSGHKFDDKEREEIEKELNVFLCYLPPYTTNILQPLDLNINALLKRNMKNSWVDWFSKENSLRKKQVIYRWFVLAWRSITSLNIIKSFLMGGISSDLNGKDDNLSNNLKLFKQQLEILSIFVSFF